MVGTVTRLTSKQAVDFLYEKALELGNIYRLNLPELSPVIVVCDPTLVRMVYEKFDEKTYLTKRIDGITGYVPNVFSKKTHGEGWDFARKSLAKSFSNSNLHQALPVFYFKLDHFMRILQEVSKERKGIDICDYSIRLTLDFLTNSMFDTDFDFLNGGTIEGKKLMENLQIVLLEYGMKTIMNPLRPYMIWDPEIYRAKKAGIMLRQNMQSILDAYRASHTAEQVEADQSNVFYFHLL